MELETFLMVILALLLVASLAAIAVKFVKIPYTIILVLIGLLVASVDLGIDFNEFINYDFIFLVLLPPLLFEGALSMNLEHLKSNYKTIMTLAIPGVLVSTFIVGYLIHAFIGLDLTVSLLFGAMISPTDPVSVLALFRKLGVSKRLSTIVEGESLFNDGTGVVIFGILLTILGGKMAGEGPLVIFGTGVLEFSIMTASGLSLGAFLGYAAYKFLGRIDDHLIEVTITFILSYGSFLIAHSINHTLGHEVVSPVLAVVAAGLIVGNFGTLLSMSASTRVALNTFWDFMTFIVNSILFLLLGIGINIFELASDAWMIVIAITVVLVSRALVVYIASAGLNSVKRDKIRHRWQHVMVWGGLRGAIPIALILLVLSTPTDAGHPLHDTATTVSHLVFGVVLFSLVVQGLTMEPLMKRLGMMTKRDKEMEYETKIGQAIASRAAMRELEQMHSCHEISEPVYEKLRRRYERRSRRLSKEIVEFLESEEVIHDQQKRHASRRSLMAMKSAVLDASKRGVISTETAEELLTEFDVDLDELEKKRE